MMARVNVRDKYLLIIRFMIISFIILIFNNTKAATSYPYGCFFGEWGAWSNSVSNCSISLGL